MFGRENLRGEQITLNAQWVHQVGSPFVPARAALLNCSFRKLVWFFLFPFFFFFSFWAWVCVCARVTRNKRFFRKPGDNTEPPFTRKRSKNRIGLLAVASRLNYQPFVTALLYNCRHDFPIFRGTFAISATELFGAIFLLIVRLQGEDKQRSVLFIFSF